MKPFFYLLLLLVSGILVAMFSRPFEQVIEALQNLGHRSVRIKTRWFATVIPRKSALPGKAWRSAAQF